MIVWLAHHRRALARALGRITGAPLGMALNMLVIGIALSLPLGLYTALSSVSGASIRLSGEPQISAFLAVDASRAEAAQIESRLKRHAQVRTYRFVPRDQALQELKQASGLADIVDSLPQNPLPDAFVIAARDSNPAALELLRDEIMQWPRVAYVQLDSAWARRLAATLRLGTLVVGLLAAVLAVTLIAVAFNTIRLQILTQQDEIGVVKLIGATDAFIRRPFLYFGAALGLGSGIAACAIVTGGVWLANRNLGELSHAYATLFHLSYLKPGDAAAVLGLAAALGWAGAWLSVRRHLHGVEH
jgi:cell division transport system permease protein